VDAAPPTAQLPVPPACEAPMRGTLAVTCATPELADVAHTATKRLRGLRLCPFASAAVTHLVVAEPKRTLKVLHAIARGAWLLTPAWLYASLEAGRWVAEDEYEDATFPGARASRLARGSAALLEGVKLAVFEPRRKAPPAGELRQLATAAGATLVKKGPCAVVIVAQGDTAGAVAACAAHKGAAVVTELWLLDALAAHKVPRTQDYAPQ
jgi:microcephalin